MQYSKCLQCKHFKHFNCPCVDSGKPELTIYPSFDIQDGGIECPDFSQINIEYTVSTENNIISVVAYMNNRKYTATVEAKENWGEHIISYAIDKAKKQLYISMIKEKDELESGYLLNNFSESTEYDPHIGYDNNDNEDISEQEQHSINNTIELVDYGNANDDEPDDTLLEDLASKHNNLHDKLNSALDNEQNFSVNEIIPNTIELTKQANNGKEFSTTLVLDENMDKQSKELAIYQGNLELEKQVAVENAKNDTAITDMDKKKLAEARDILNKYLQDNTPNNSAEDTLNGDIKIGWFMQTTSWLRVVNAARRTIGKKPIITEPSDSWKAKILLAEHSPIRLLEYDWGWEKIRQWVSVHLVRHHEGVEKFVHSQRSDRRELPCDRDHLYQGARNDMDMTANAQGLINMSRKRCCNCASTETREAWKLVLDELEKKDPVMRAKCVRECVYRGFCPEWMSKCGYYKTDAFKKERAGYVNTLYGNDVKYYYYKSSNIIVSNTGHVYNASLDIDKGLVMDNSVLGMLEEVKYEKIWCNGHYEIMIRETHSSVDTLVFNAFNTEGLVANKHEILHIDGNEWNNNINNLKLIDTYI